MVTHILIKVQDYSVPKARARNEAIDGLIIKTPALDKQYEEVYYEVCNVDKAREIIIARHNTAIVKEEPLLLNSEDEWGFAIAYDIEWDGLGE